MLNKRGLAMFQRYMKEMQFCIVNEQEYRGLLYKIFLFRTSYSLYAVSGQHYEKFIMWNELEHRMKLQM